MVDPQSLDVPALLAGVTLVVLLAGLGWYAYARGTRHGEMGAADEAEEVDRPGPPPS